MSTVRAVAIHGHLHVLVLSFQILCLRSRLHAVKSTASLSFVCSQEDVRNAPVHRHLHVFVRCENARCGCADISSRDVIEMMMITQYFGMLLIELPLPCCKALIVCC